MPYQTRNGTVIKTVTYDKTTGNMKVEIAPDRDPRIDEALAEFQRLTAGMLDAATRDSVDRAFVQLAEKLLLEN